MNIAKEKKPHASIYSQVADSICESIITGELSAFDKLPTESQLAKQIGVNRLTVSRGYGSLRQRGIITQRRGQGSFVSTDADKLLGLAPRRRLRNVAVVLQSESLEDVPAQGQIALLDMIFGVSRRFEELATHVCHVPLNDNSEIRQEWIKRFDAFIIIGYSATTEQLIKLAQQEERPCVMIWPNLHENEYFEGVPIVSYDRECAVKLGVDHLIASGYQQIGFIGNSAHSSSAIKIKTFIATMKKRGLPINEQWMLTTGIGIGSAYLEMHKFLAADKPLPQAFFADTDYKALEVMHALQARDINVPEQIAICGFDDIADAASSEPALTTVRTPRQDAGYSAADLLLNWLPGAATPDNMILPSKLIVRQTTPSIK